MKKNDFILIAILLLLAVAGIALFTALQSGGDTVLLLIDGREEARFSLSAAVERQVVTSAGENTLVIADGKAYISAADCPDGICVAHRPISKVGETIVCLPHRVVVKVVRDGSVTAPDIVVQ